jgi:hypothetical protein
MYVEDGGWWWGRFAGVFDLYCGRAGNQNELVEYPRLAPQASVWRIASTFAVHDIYALGI